MHPPAQDVNLEKPSMKVPPKRKGNPRGYRIVSMFLFSLNESPSEKEGKSCGMVFLARLSPPQ